MTESRGRAGGSGTRVGRRRFLAAGVGLAAATPAMGQILVPPSALAEPDPPGGVDDARWRTCQRLARELLLVGPNGEDLKLQYLKILINNGLPKTTRPKKVLVVGAGIAGLTAGWLLKQAGHHVTIIEANGNRIGGR